MVIIVIVSQGVAGGSVYTEGESPTCRVTNSSLVETIFLSEKKLTNCFLVICIQV